MGMLLKSWFSPEHYHRFAVLCFEAVFLERLDILTTIAVRCCWSGVILEGPLGSSSGGAQLVLQPDHSDDADYDDAD